MSGSTILQIDSTANITTSGSSAAGYGILGQNTSGDGNITITSSGNVTTTSNDFATYAIYGWGAGAGLVTINSSGVVTTNSGNGYGLAINNSNGSAAFVAGGTISTTGSSAHGIITNATLGSTATVSGSISTTGSGAHGVYFATSGTNSIDITSTGSVSSLLGNAIDASGVTTVANAGTISGNVRLTSGTFNNNAGGTLNTGTFFNIGSGTLNNAGTVRLNGGTGTVGTVALTGNYVQTSTGVLRTRADWANSAADKLAITGTANLAGTVVVDPVSFPTTGGLSKSFTVLTAAGGITMNGIAAQNTAAVTYALVKAGANTLNVNAAINFAPTTPTPATSTPAPSGLAGIVTSGLTSNNLAAGQNLNTILGGGTTLGFMPALLQLPSTGQLGQALGQLSPNGTGGSFSTTISTGNTFAGHLLSCRIAGEEGDVTRFIKEGQCVWARVTQRRFDNDGRGDGVGYRENATLFTAGAQLKVAPDWRIGGGIGYETTDLSANSNASSAAERLHLGGVVKYNPGAWLFAASVTGGFGWSDNRRNVSFDGFGATATSSNDSSFVGGRLTAAYTLARGALYLKPQVEFAATHLMRDGYTEHGGSGIALRVDKSDATVLSLSPSLELGVEQRGQGGFVTRAFVKGGATFRDTDTFATTATFVDAPVGTSSFSVTSKVDKTVADVGAGLDLISQGGTSLRLQYDGQFGEHTTQHSGGAKIGVKF